MELAGLFSNADNIYKFTFIGSFLMVFFSITYPIKKKNEIDLAIINYNLENEKTNLEIKALRDKIMTLQSKVSMAKKSLIDTKEGRSINHHAIPMKDLDSLKISYLNEFAKIEQERLELNQKNIISKYNKNRVSILERQAGQYKRYSGISLYIGIIICSVSLVLWSLSTYKAERLKSLNLKELEQRINANVEKKLPLAIYFTRVIKFIKQLFRRN